MNAWYIVFLRDPSELNSNTDGSDVFHVCFLSTQCVTRKIFCLGVNNSVNALPIVSVFAVRFRLHFRPGYSPIFSRRRGLNSRYYALEIHKQTAHHHQSK